MTFRPFTGWPGVAAAFAALAWLSAGAVQAAPPAFAPSEVLVGVREDAGAADDETRGRIEAIAGPILGKQDRIKAYRVRVKKGLSVEEAIARLRSAPGVAYAEPNLSLRAFGTPSDTYYGSHQYGPQKVGADFAWGAWKPQAQTVIAVIDTGVQMDHPDLVSKVVGGFDFVNNDADPSDDHGHGTHCAGIAAAQINNGKGIAGIAGWDGNAAASDSTYTKVLAVKVLGADGSGYTSAVADGIVYAADNGAKVISLSLGGGASTTLQNAVNYAYGKGCVLVAAAGNGSTSAMSYPAGYANVVSVASTDSGDALSWFSNYGAWVKVAAPGQDIVSTYPGSGYAYMSGTSMAAPLVAGQAALIRSHNPALSNAQVESAIVDNTDPFTPYNGRTIGGGRVNVYRALLAATPDTATPPPPPPTSTAPSAPSNLSGQAISRSQINLTWTDNATNEDGFYVERSSDGGSFAVVATLGANATGYSDAGLSGFNTYYYRVRAFSDAAGSSGYSNTVKVRTRRK